MRKLFTLAVLLSTWIGACVSTSPKSTDNRTVSGAEESKQEEASEKKPREKTRVQEWRAP